MFISNSLRNANSHEIISINNITKICIERLETGEMRREGKKKEELTEKLYIFRDDKRADMKASGQQ